MAEWIKCIDANIRKNEDGTMDCPWLAPYFGDMTPEEYEKRGTALSVRRGCEYCYKMLEWRTRLNEEGWLDNRTVAHASHPNAPGEWICVNEIIDSNDSIVGYEVQFILYNFLHCIQEDGWELIFSYFSEGKKILEMEVDNVPKQTYYTKCGRKFEKNTTAAVTGYEIDESDPQCKVCPFQVDVTEGYPPVHKRWECRAGSKKPNKNNEWTGRLDDKTNLNIKSLDNNFLESIREYCESQPDLSAHYTQDIEDCRRVLSVSCSANKKGIAAKVELVEKFFERLEGDSHSDKTSFEPCPFFEGIGKGDTLKYYKKCNALPSDYPKEYLKYDKKADAEGCAATCRGEKDKELCRFYNEKKNTESTDNVLKRPLPTPVCGHCEHRGFSFGACMESESSYYHIFRRPLDEHCAKFESKDEEKIMSETCVNCMFVIKGEGNSRVKCSEHPQKGNFIPTKDCPNYTPFTESLNLYNYTEHEGQDNEETISVKEDASLELSESTEIKEFDYSTVDEETAEFLQDKANKITEIRIKSVMAIGRELKEVHGKLASHDKNKGTYMAWVKSIGISWDTANNYIRAYDYVSENFGNIESAENIKPSLIFAVSKPSAPTELSQKVISGDITTLKEYKELEKQLQETEKELNVTQSQLKGAKESVLEKTQECNDLKAQNKNLSNDCDDYRTRLAEQVRKNQEKDNELKARPIEIVEKPVVPPDVQKELELAKQKKGYSREDAGLIYSVEVALEKLSALKVDDIKLLEDSFKDNARYFIDLVGRASNNLKKIVL